MKVLLVEDDADIQIVTRTALTRAGFAVRVAGSGRAALDAARADAPDVILLDWMMPDMEGPEVCRRLKDDPATRAIPVIFMTARSRQSEIEHGLDLGAAGFIVKPFDVLALGGRVREILGVP